MPKTYQIDSQGKVTAFLPRGILAQILTQTDADSKQRFAQIGPVCNEIANHAATYVSYEQHVPQNLRALLSLERAEELAVSQNIPEFMRKYYSITPEREALPVRVLLSLGKACHAFLSAVRHPALPPVRIKHGLDPIELDERLNEEKEDLVPWALITSILLGTVGYFLMIYDLMLLAGNNPKDLSERKIRIASGILVPGLTTVSLLILLMHSDLGAQYELENINKPEASIGSYNEWLILVRNEIRSPVATFLNLPYREERMAFRPTRNCAYYPAAVIALPTLIYSATIHPEYFSLGLITICTHLCSKDIDEQTPSMQRFINGAMLALFIIWGVTVGLAYHNETIREFVDEHLDLTPKYNRAVIGMDLANLAITLLTLAVLLVKNAPKIAENIKATGQTLLHNWRNRPVQRELRLEEGVPHLPLLRNN